MSAERPVLDAVAARVRRLIATSGLTVPDEHGLGAWISLVAAWNARIDLTAARTEDELCDLMLADALVLAAKIPEGARVVDIGSGAGAPGLPLAIARPDLTVTLVEPLQKRVAFLRTSVGSVMAGGRMPVVVRGRGEDLAAKGERFDVAISRATLAPGLWLALGGRLAPEVWVLLAREEPPAHADMRVAEDMRYRWLLTGAERRAVRFTAACDAR